jgi:hypothetical protein
MRFRAGLEETNYALTPEFFRDALLIGTQKFFGITFEGSIEKDEQNPDSFCCLPIEGGQLKKHFAPSLVMINAFLNSQEALAERVRPKAARSDIGVISG